MLVDSSDVALPDGGGATPAAALVGAPAAGMVFPSAESAWEFYCAYAARTGFRVRKNKSFTSRLDDGVIMRRFVCTRQGLPARKVPQLDASKKRRNRASARAVCPAMIQVNRRPGPGASTHWVISRCVFDHTHPLGDDDDDSEIGGTESTDTSNRRSSKSPKALSGQIANANSESFHLNALGPGGNVTQSLLEHFKKMQADNPTFCYAVQLDRSNCVTNLVWVDARARLLYKWFGDAVVLDVTCKRNLHAVPFVALTGLNHHRQVIVFGCALMTDESEDSFVWLFETWLAFMDGKKPVSFTMNYARDVEMAAMKVFREVRQRFCRRDIFSNSKERLAAVYAEHPSFKQELKACVNKLERIDEFESTWRLLLNKCNLSGNEWLQTIYNIRHQWVPVYLKDSFFSEMLNAPKLETMMKFLRRNFISTSLPDLVMQFDKAILRHYQNELQRDIASFCHKMVMRTTYPMEKQASELYTNLIFGLFQDELVGSSDFAVLKVETGHISKFEVTKSGIANRRYTVVYNEPGNNITCSCHKFEFAGILCRHVLRVLMVIGILVLPEKYILKRWTINAKTDILAAVPESSKGSLVWRCNDLCRDAIRFAEEGATSAEIYKIAKEALLKAFAETRPQRKFHSK